MAIQTGTFLTYSAIGLREDLSNIIYNISPTSTPFINNIGKGTAKQTLFEWQTDALATAAANAQLVGDDVTATADTQVATVRLGNRTQISRKLVLVSDTLESVDKAGRKSDMALLMSKAGLELKRDMEFILLSNTGAVTGNSTTAPKTASLLAFLKTNVDFDTTSGVNPTYTSGVPGAARTDGTVRAFTETILKSVLQKVWTSGGDPKMVMVGPVNKQKVSAFSGIATRFRDVAPGKQAQIVGAADIYIGDFGQVDIVANRFQRERDAFVLDPEYVSLDYLRPMQQKELAKTGDAEKRMLIAEYGLRVMNEAAMGLAADLVTS